MVLKSRLEKAGFFYVFVDHRLHVDSFLNIGLRSMFLTEAFPRKPADRPRCAAVLMVLTFFVLSGNACAEWDALGNDGDSVTYIDAETITRTGDLATVWILKDYRQMQTGPSREKFKSTKIYYEFKCSENLVRQSYLTRYYGQMAGAGSFPSDARFHPWTAIVPGTEMARLAGLVCK